MTRKYTYSPERAKRDFLQANWKQRLQVHILKGKKMSDNDIAAELGMKRQQVQYIWKRTKHLRLGEVMHLAYLLE